MCFGTWAEFWNSKQCDEPPAILELSKTAGCNDFQINKRCSGATTVCLTYRLALMVPGTRDKPWQMLGVVPIVELFFVGRWNICFYDIVKLTDFMGTRALQNR
jgi:hypothetical protein